MTEKVLRANARWQPLQEKPFLVRMLVYGPPKVGKTTFAAAARNCAFLNIVMEDGLNSVSRDGREDLLVADIASRQDLDNALSDLEARAFPYETVVLDSFSTLVDPLLKQDALHHPRRKAQLDPDYVQREDWQRITEVAKAYLYRLKQLPANLIVIAQEKEVQLDAERLHTLHLTPKLAADFPYYFDFIGWMFVQGAATDEPRYYMRIAPFTSGTAGARVPPDWLPYMPTVIQDATFPKLLKLLSRARKLAKQARESGEAPPLAPQQPPDLVPTVSYSSEEGDA